MTDSRRHLLSIDDLGRDGIAEILRFSDSCAAIGERAIPKVPALRGKTVATLFFEASTRTRLSFETAAKRLSADTVSFSVSNSSMEKGESLRDTVETIDAMGVDVMVVRHGSVGAPNRVAQWVNASVVNAGDGAHEHPTQALSDCYTIRAIRAEQSGVLSDDFSGMRIAIVGDVRHSRVARSCVAAFTALGAEVTIVGPSTLLPPSLANWPVKVHSNLDEVLGDVDVVYMLRLQSERMHEAFIPSLGEYRSRFGLTAARAASLRKGTLIMHPGPMNRGVEIDGDVAATEQSVILRQVKSGVAIRMAVFFWLLGTSGPLPGASTPAESANALLFDEVPNQHG